VLTVVDIALGQAATSACARGIPAGAGVDVTLIIEAVAGSQCPAT